LPQSLRYLAIAEVVVTCALCLALAVWLVVLRYSRVVQQSQPVFMHIMLVGCAVSSFAIIGLAVDDSQGLNASAACNEAPIVFSLGFLLALSALWGKTIRLKSVFAGTTLHVGLRISTVIRRMLAMMLVQGVWVALFLGVGALQWVRVVQVYDAHGFPLQSLGSCSSPSPATAVFLTLMFFTNVVVLMWTSQVANSMKQVPEEFQEARFVSMATTVLLQIAILSVPVVFAVYTSVIGRFVILSCLVFFANLTIIAIIFFPKVRHSLARHVVVAEQRPERAKIANDLGVVESLKIPRVRQRFEKFAAEAQTIEHAHFLTDVEEWRNAYRSGTKTNEQLREDAVALVKMYIHQGAFLQVNISSRAREEVEDAMAATASAVGLDVFAPAISEVEQMLLFGAWADFCEDGGLFGVDGEIAAIRGAPPSARPSSVGAGSSPSLSGVLSAAANALSRMSKKQDKVSSSTDLGTVKKASNNSTTLTARSRPTSSNDLGPVSLSGKANNSQDKV